MLKNGATSIISKSIFATEERFELKTDTAINRTDLASVYPSSIVYIDEHWADSACIPALTFAEWLIKFYEQSFNQSFEKFSRKHLYFILFFLVGSSPTLQLQR